MNKSMLCAFAAAILCISGCGAGYTSIYRDNSYDTDKLSVVSVDAKQRMLMTNPVNGQLRVCAEQFPDVFTVLSSSLSGSGSILPSSGRTEIQGALAAALNEAGSTIRRTQTVNILRESMYRTCERYMSGAIDKEELSVQAARDVRAMVSVLAIEQLTGLITPPETTIGFNSSATAAGGAAQIAESLNTAKLQLEEDTKTRDTIKVEYEKALADAGKEKCEELSGGEDVEKQKQCITARENLKKADDKVKTTREHYDLITKLAVNYSTLSSKARNISATDRNSGVHYLEEAKSIEAVTATVRNIVELNFSSTNGRVPCEAVLVQYANWVIAPNDIPGDAETILNECLIILKNASKASSEATQILARPTSADGPLNYELDIDFVASNNSNQGFIDFLNNQLSTKLNNIYIFSSATLDENLTTSEIRIGYFEGDARSKAVEVYREVQSLITTKVCIFVEDAATAKGAGDINILLPENIQLGVGSPQTPPPTCEA